MADETRAGPAGRVLATNIKRIRDAQRLTYTKLSKMLAEAGRDLPILALRRIERMERRVDFDDLLALAYVLRVCPVDLMVSSEASDEPYALTLEHEFEADTVREWIRGEDVLLAPVSSPGDPFSDPGTAMLDAIQWMPADRRKRVMRRWLDNEEEHQ
jgi:hypothetical protein